MTSAQRPSLVDYRANGRPPKPTFTAGEMQGRQERIRGWMAKIDVDPKGGIACDPQFLVEFEDGLRPHQVRLQGGDASSDSFCYAA